jgi:hypothetical protein
VTTQELPVLQLTEEFRPERGRLRQDRLVIAELFEKTGRLATCG